MGDKHVSALPLRGFFFLIFNYQAHFMIQNFLLVAARNFFRHRMQSILNTSGLAIGLACAIYVFLYVHDELTYDTQHPDPKNTYRVLTKMKDPEGKEQTRTWAIAGWTHYMKENLKGVKSYSQINTSGWLHSFYYKPKKGEQRVALSEGVVYASKNYTEFFFLDLIAGDKNTLFEEPTNIAISQSEARQLFGDEDPIDKQVEFSHPLRINNAKTTVVVKGVFRDLPYNIQLGKTTKYILNSDLKKVEYERRHPNHPFESLLTSMWFPAVDGYTYIKTEPGADLAYIKRKTEAEINKAVAAKGKEVSPIGIEFLNITESHFSDIPYLLYPDVKGNRQYVYIFSLIGLFILTISCINYTNLATARGMTRAKEIGIRKAIGSRRIHIVMQFLQEAFFVTGVSVILALVIAILLLPSFNDFARKDFLVTDLLSVTCISAILLLWLIVSVCAGFYPAFHVASFNTIKVLKGVSHSGAGTGVIRQGLMVFQFSVAMILVVFTFVVIQQMDKMINTDLNEAGDQIMTIRYGNVAPYDKLQVLQDEFSKYPDLSVSSFGNYIPRIVGHAPLTYEVTVPGVTTANFTWHMMSVGANYHKVFDLELVAGQFFDPSGTIDSTEILVNEEAARQLNMHPRELTGQQVIVTDVVFNRKYELKIRGVIKDFKYKSIHSRVEPLILSLQKERHGSIAYFVKLLADRIQQGVARVEKIWKQVMPPDIGLKYNFLSDEFNALYFEENTLHDLSRIFTVLAIVTSCLGVFGMSVFLAERRNKEMAIRKVMGANSSDVVQKMVTPFLKMIALACVIGLPVSYYLTKAWLNNYVYKVEMNWLISLLSVLLLAIITIFTVSYQSLKVALANPVEALKYE